MTSFFVSYNKADSAWAEWIAWTLEEAGHTVVIQAWDMRPGSNFVLGMHNSATDCEKTVLVLSEDYLKSEFTQPEWAVAFAEDPKGVGRKIIPVRVQECEPKGLLRPIVYVDLVNLDEESARKSILDALPDRLKPDIQPAFPKGRTNTKRTITRKPIFPSLLSQKLWPPSPQTPNINEDGDEKDTPSNNFLTDFISDRWRLFMTCLLCTISTSSIILFRNLGMLQVWELHTFDWMMNHRLGERPDDRIVIIGVTEQDMMSFRNASLSDDLLADLIEKVKAENPTVIGMDFFRNVRHDDGYDRLQKIFAETPKLIGIEKVIDDEALSAVAGNSVLVQNDQVAASDLIVDIDGRVRRGFLFPSAVGERVIEELAFRVALEYLASHDIEPNPHSEILELGLARFPPFERNSGGYSNADAGGYQLVMNWRSNLAFQTFSAQEVISGDIPPGTLGDKVVLIGSMQSGDADVFFTPYSHRKGTIGMLPSHGIEIHASLASQIISAAFGQRQTLKTPPPLVDSLLIAAFSLLGIGLFRLGKNDLVRMRNLGVCGVCTTSTSYIALTVGGWWLPILPITLALIAAPLVDRLQKIKTLEMFSQRDELTQLVNKRSFQKHLEQSWQWASQSSSPISLILCDVDDFGLYEELYGHRKGENCLRKVAQAISSTVNRPGDLAARYDREKFAILLPNTDELATEKVANDTEKNVHQLKIVHTSSQTSSYISISLGVTTIIPKPNMSINALIETASMRLGDAKRKRKGQLMVHSPTNGLYKQGNFNEASYPENVNHDESQ
ncbi:MAG: CHASE2 domain-containing protein [Cyanobacteria bacterium P01_F01_bin.86]